MVHLVHSTVQTTQRVDTMLVTDVVIKALIQSIQKIDYFDIKAIKSRSGGQLCQTEQLVLMCDEADCRI